MREESEKSFKVENDGNVREVEKRANDCKSKMRELCAGADIRDTKPPRKGCDSKVLAGRWDDERRWVCKRSKLRFFKSRNLKKKISKKKNRVYEDTREGTDEKL
jgi:hypothetical protein